jgi:hypothetical protein
MLQCFFLKSRERTIDYPNGIVEVIDLKVLGYY